MRRLILIAAATLLVLPVSCRTSGLPSGATGPDEWGHRPGPRGFRTVILDAGHGGSDPGAVSRWTGMREKDLALDTCRRIARELGGNFRVILLRDGDRFVDLDDRVRFADRHGDAVLVSMHYNAGPPGISGPETYYWRVDSYSLARRIQRHLEAALPNGRGNLGLVRRRLRLTRNPDIPCVLVEGGYLSHPAESRRIASASYRDTIAKAVAAGIRDQAAFGDVGMGPLPRPIFAPPSRPTDAPE